jgi:hypothetical protein
MIEYFLEIQLDTYRQYVLTCKCVTGVGTQYRHWAIKPGHCIVHVESLIEIEPPRPATTLCTLKIRMGFDTNKRTAVVCSCPVFCGLATAC